MIIISFYLTFFQDQVLEFETLPLYYTDKEWIFEPFGDRVILSDYVGEEGSSVFIYYELFNFDFYETLFDVIEYNPRSIIVYFEKGVGDK